MKRVYRIYDADGRLLYVGSTNNVDRRIREHQWWLRRVPGYRVEATDPMPTEVALDVERRAITLEGPLRNVHHSGLAQVMNVLAERTDAPLPEMTHDLMRRPLSIGSERVCLAAATAKDFELWAIDERRDAAQEFSARSAACDGAEWLAQQMRQQGHALFADAYAQDDAA